MSFGVFELDPEAGQLRKSGVRIKLQEQPFQVLALLLERPGEIVTREEIIEKLWPDGTFVEFDRSLNIAVNKIREALGDSASHPRFVETVPRRGYRFVAGVELLEPTSRPRGRKVWLVAALGVAVVAGGFGLREWHGGEKESIASAPVPLTSYHGRELFPTFSPDGTEIAFAWNGEREGNFDIYRCQIAPDETLLRLTDHPADEVSPVWSPDRQSIAFLRSLGGERQEVIIIPALGGAERRLGEVSAYRERYGTPEFGLPPFRALDWSPDGQWLAVVDRIAPESPSAIFLFSPSTGKKTVLTDHLNANYGDVSPAFSPDGRLLAFCRRNYSHAGGHLHVVALSEGSQRPAEARRVAAEFSNVANPIWSSDGRDILFVDASQATMQVWRVPASGRGTVNRAPQGQDATLPVVSGPASRMAYVRWGAEINIWRLDVPGRDQEPVPPRRFIASTRSDSFPDFSPDGTSVAFTSTRSGVQENWISDDEGRRPRKLLSSWLSDITGSPRWSPDGARIAFDSRVNGRWEIFVVSASGGEPIRLTEHPAGGSAPNWSHDGEWIYFGCGRGGRVNICRIPSEGGEALQITRNGGHRPAVSKDGTWVYYIKVGEHELWRAPAAGGEETLVLRDVQGPGYSVTEDGVYFIRTPDPDGNSSIQFYSFDTEEIRQIAPIEGVALTRYVDCEVSPDGKSILFRRAERREADIMLVENFR